MSSKAKSDPQPDPISARADESVMSGGRMLFTGPDYLRDHRVKVDDEAAQRAGARAARPGWPAPR